MLLSTGLFTHMPHGTGIFTYIYNTFKPNVGKYAIHGSYGFSVVSRSNMDFTSNRIKALAPFKISVFFGETLLGESH